jgi:hypothetical protein
LNEAVGQLLYSSGQSREESSSSEIPLLFYQSMNQKMLATICYTQASITNMGNEGIEKHG